MTETKTQTIMLNSKEYYCNSLPTRQCLICETLEYPDADIINARDVWLCKRCRRKLNDFVHGVIAN